MIGTWQIVLIILVLLLLFGGKKIPDLMRGIGQGIKEFKNSMKGEDIKEETKKENSK
ncbi:MAG: twin-arginine translocase TatA/TatE family subunit [Bacteroidia bacterium]|nr:twin-arginine translocase TatA/TatE family subunit [Bacteroidia bacterium]